MRLLNEHTTAFEHTLWDRHDLIEAARRHPGAVAMHHDQINRYGYSFLQDAFYALSGKQPNESPAGGMWRKAMQHETWAEIQSLFDRGGMDQTSALLQVAAVMQKSFEGSPIEDARESHDGSAQDAQDAPSADTGDGDAGNRSPVDGNRIGDAPDKAELFRLFLVEQGDLIEADPDAEPLRSNLGVEFGMQWGFDAEDAQRYGTVYGMAYSFLGDDMDMELRQTKAMEVLDHVVPMAVTDMIGIGERVSNAEDRKVHAQVGVLTGYRHVGICDDVVPEEMAALGRGDLYTMVQAGEGTLTAVQFEGEEPYGKGPVVVLTDETSSTRTPSNFGRWGIQNTLKIERSLVFALAQVMNEEGRDVVEIPWSTNGTRGPFVFGAGDLNEHWRVALGGTTRIEHALMTALLYTEEYVDGADILVVTDGRLHSDPTGQTPEGELQNVEDPETGLWLHEVLAGYRERGGRVWVISLAENPERTMRWADGYIRGSDLDGDTVELVFHRILSENERITGTSGRRHL